MSWAFLFLGKGVWFFLFLVLQGMEINKSAKRTKLPFKKKEKSIGNNKSRLCFCSIVKSSRQKKGL